MAVIRVNKTDNYTIMSNFHLRDKSLSLKAKGLLSQMLSLPPSWDYTINGLVAINQEKKSAITSALKELREHGYLVVTKKMPNETDSGRIEYIYDIYEQSQTIQAKEKQDIENQCLENRTQLNTERLNTDELKTKNKRFVPPSISEVSEYCQERKNGIDAEYFVDYYTARDWQIGKNKMKDWKAAVRTWERNSYSSSKKSTVSRDDSLDDIF